MRYAFFFLAFVLGFPALLLALSSLQTWARISLALAYAFAMIVVIMRLFARPERRMRLLADKQAAELAGKEGLLHVLKKIDEIVLRSVKPRGDFTRRFRVRPSLGERIENLKAA